MGRTEPALSFLATLAPGRSCLAFDSDGAAILRLELSQPEAAKVAARLSDLTDTALAVAIKPVQA